MSELFFRRLAELLPELYRAVEPEERVGFDAEVERLTSLDCDVAAQRLSASEFRRVAEEALRNLRKRRRPAEIPAIA